MELAFPACPSVCGWNPCSCLPQGGEMLLLEAPREARVLIRHYGFWHAMQPVVGVEDLDKLFRRWHLLSRCCPMGSFR